MSTVDPSSPEFFTNREISWLDFNARVLAAAKRPDVPLLERLRFVAIAANNLDEFYMIRVAGLERQKLGKVTPIDSMPDARRPLDLLAEIGVRAKDAACETARVLTESILPPLRAHGVFVLGASELDAAQRSTMTNYYRVEVHPCLTPIAIDPVHPFPHLRNRSLNIAFKLQPPPGKKGKPFAAPEGTTLFALAQVPSVLPRFVPLPAPGAKYAFMALEDVIAMHANELFPGHEIIEARPFRVTRAADLDIAEDEAENLLTTIQHELRRRDRGEAIRLELSGAGSEDLMDVLRTMLGVDPQHVHAHSGFIVTSALSAICDLDLPELRYPQHSPVVLPQIRMEPSIFRVLNERDVLLHHPYESFTHVADFMNQAADDPDVVAIKQTLYRTGGDSSFVRALARAAANGKQVTALVELKARFEEAANIRWARALEESGVHVVYGLLGLKTHCKISLVIRREGGRLRRYLHLSTGNYNENTARQYTDLSLLTSREDFTSDAMLLFNVLTGYAELPGLERLIVSPFQMREHLTSKINREIAHAEAGRPAQIIAKMNALVEPGIIRQLYRASQSGVRIDLLVRGICCLKPGIPGLSENIRVRGIIDRFLEHARVTYFANGGEEEVYLSSADWMPRNLNRRIEVAWPVLDPLHRQRIRDEILGTEMDDDTNSWLLDANGAYVSSFERSHEHRMRAQQAFIDIAQRRLNQPPVTVRREFSATRLGASPAVRAMEVRGRRRKGGR